MLNVNEIPHREALEEIVHKTSPETRIFLLKHIQKSWRVSFSHLLLSGLINPIFHRYPHIWQAKSEHHTKALTPRQVVAQLVLRSDMSVTCSPYSLHRVK